MKNNARSAIIGAMAATFVVAAAFAPHLLSSSKSVNVHTTATEETTSTTELLSTPDTLSAEVLAPATSASVPAPAIENRVTNVENRVSVLEASTTTTRPEPQYVAPVASSTTTTVPTVQVHTPAPVVSTTSTTVLPCTKSATYRSTNTGWEILLTINAAPSSYMVYGADITAFNAEGVATSYHLGRTMVTVNSFAPTSTVVGFSTDKPASVTLVSSDTPTCN